MVESQLDETRCFEVETTRLRLVVRSLVGLYGRATAVLMGLYAMLMVASI
jgi:hypothetical protein